MKCIFLVVAFFCTSYNVFANREMWNSEASRRNWTPMMIFVYQNQKSKIDSMIRTGVDINVQNPNGYTPLWVAIMKGDSRSVEYLLINGANVNVTDTTGESLLMTACGTNGYRIAKLLISYGAYINYKRGGYTALMSATRFARPRLLRLLIANGADVNTGREINYTAVYLARYGFYLGHVYKRKYRILKRHGAIE